MPEAGIAPNVTLWMFDFDGTLSPLVADRTAAKLDPTCHEMLCQLAAMEGFCCAILSSRHLADLASRVDIAGIYLGGSSGIEWKLPDGRLQVPEADWMEGIRRSRETLIPEIMEWSHLPGVEIEDKHWSVAVHIRWANQQVRQELTTLLVGWQQARNIPLLRGPEVIEVQLLAEVNKASGVRTLCELVNCNPSADRFFYAGDDENDAVAMQLVRAWGGTVVTVGEKAITPDSEVVSSPMELAKKISIWAGLVGITQK
jgi:trehalose 6-phosphate phosphatase